MDDAEKAVAMTRLSILRTTAEAIQERIKTDVLAGADADDINIRNEARQFHGSLLRRAETLHKEINQDD